MKICVLLLLLPTAVMAKTGNWPQGYNNGVLAYKSNDFARAAAAFENATASQDRTLQQRSLYNLGNASYRLGQRTAAQTQQLWERALKSYETALALDPKDADAKFNHDFVKKKLEELKKQQQQNQKKQQNKPPEQKKDEQKQQQQEQDQQNSKDRQSEQQEQQQSQEQQKQGQEPKDKQQEQQARQQQSSQPEQNPMGKGGEPEDYDKMQATALLNDLRENERNWNFFPEVQMKDLKDSSEPAKDW